MGQHDVDLEASLTALQQGECSSVELVKLCLARAAQQQDLGAVVEVVEQEALAAAMASDLRRKQGAPLGPLDGVPVVLKDNILRQGWTFQCASNILQGFRAPYDATVTQRLLRQGAVLLGRANMDEFAMGSTTETSAYGVCRNPWDKARTPGGSSGGSAAAVAAQIAPAALGTDTGGSIRQPAAMTGLVGCKPTYGRVSRYGVVAYASSLDQVGPLAYSVRTARWLLSCLSGFDALDATSSQQPPVSATDGQLSDLQGVRLGVPSEYFGPGLDPQVHQAVQAALTCLEGLGATLIPVHLPHTAYAIATYYILATAEASSNLARFDGVRYGFRHGQGIDLNNMYQKTRGEGFGAEVKRRILLGTYVLSAGHYDAYYQRAQTIRRLVAQDFAQAFAQVDCIVTPTSPKTAGLLGQRSKDPAAAYLADVYTVPVNLAGLPALSMPCGVDPNGLPIGLQWIGPAWQEERLFDLAAVYERATSWHRRRPQ